MNKFIIALALIAAVAFAEEIAVSTKMIREINSRQSLWRAAHNPITRMPASQARRLLGVDINALDNSGLDVRTYSEKEIADTPTSFDAREQWPACVTMKEIRNQKHCGSCWAFGAVEAMSDRICVTHKENVRLSAEDMNSCSRAGILSTSCGSCQGGQPACAWKYWYETGVVTDECQPYTAGNDSTLDTPKCKSVCFGNPSIDYKSDKRKGQSHYSLVGETNMMAELVSNGPFEVAFRVYADFFSYSSGIYTRTSNEFRGGHAVKLIGYGEEGGVKYWTCANSWDVTWGERGFFRIRRGNNECGIESQAWGGVSA